MFGLIQKHKKVGIALIVIASASFIFWMFSVSDVKQMFGGGACVVSVKDECVTLREYRFELMKYAQLLDEPSFVPVVKRLVLNSLITREVLAKRAEELGLLVSDEELLEVIKSNPNFQRDGKFSLEVYRETLGRLNLSPQEYEEILKKSLMAQKVLKLIEKGVYLLPEEVDIQKRYISTLLSGKLYIVKSKDVKLNYKPTEEELRKFYMEHKEEYKEEGKEIFFLWKIQNKEDAQSVYKSLKEGKIEGRYLELARKELPEEVKEIAKKLKPGEFKLLKRGETYYIVLFKEKVPPKVKPFKEVREEVKKAYIEKLRSEKLRDYAERIKEKIIKGEGVELKPISFEKHDIERLKKVLLIPPEEISELIFGKGKVFGPYKVLGGMGILVIEKRERGELKPDELKKIEEELLRTKVQDLQGLYVEKLIRTYGVRVNEELIK